MNFVVKKYGGDKSEWNSWEEQPHGLVFEQVPRLHAWVLHASHELDDGVGASSCKRERKRENEVTC